MSKKQDVNEAATKLMVRFNMLRDRVAESAVKGRRKFNNKLKELRNLSKKKKKGTKAQRKQAREDTQRAILGVGLLLVVVSIAYSTSVIYIGVDSDASKIALIPQATFALVTLFKAFSKLYK